MISKWLIMLMILTPYVCGKDITSVTKSLENAAEIAFTWFKNNQR